jgi:mannose-1-phosphate guanylyltransferase
LESFADIAMAQAGFRWSDLGSWQSLLDVNPSDRQGNNIDDVVTIDCKNSYISATANTPEGGRAA